MSHLITYNVAKLVAEVDLNDYGNVELTITGWESDGNTTVGLTTGQARELADALRDHANQADQYHAEQAAGA